MTPNALLEPQGPSLTQPILSLCIATLNREKYIGQTLASIVPQLSARVELVIVDGASTDDTPAIVKSFADGSPHVRYHRLPTNSGIDRDFDTAVSLCNGDYGWLMTDDDLLVPDAIARVLKSLAESPQLLVVNARIMTADLSKVLQTRRLDIDEDSTYLSGDMERLFEMTADYLSFIGAVVIERKVWMERERAPFFGTLFVHVGVIFQGPPLTKAMVIAEPLILIRYGNAMWTPRGFEIWMFKWPKLVWSFTSFSTRAKASVCAAEPWRSTRSLLSMRANGAYSTVEYERFLRQHAVGAGRMIAKVIASVPASIANSLAVLFWLLGPRKLGTGIYDIARSRHAGWLGRWCEKTFL